MIFELAVTGITALSVGTYITYDIIKAINKPEPTVQETAAAYARVYKKTKVESDELDGANKLYRCNLSSCSRYSRFYQQRLAWLAEKAKSQPTSKHRFKYYGYETICPHCRKANVLFKSDDDWEFLKTHPDCLMIDEAGYIEVEATIEQVKTIIAEAEEIKAFQEYNDLLKPKPVAPVNAFHEPFDKNVEEYVRVIREAFQTVGIDLSEVEKNETPKNRR